LFYIALRSENKKTENMTLLFKSFLKSTHSLKENSAVKAEYFYILTFS